MLSSPPSQQRHSTLTDELAAATNELLDLSSTGLKSLPHLTLHEAPLPTPSPLNLASSSTTTHQTLGSIISVKDNARLELIYDDEDDVPGPSTKARQKQTEHFTATLPDSLDLPYDHDDNLPSSRLSSIIASVSNDTNFSNHSLLSPRLPVVEEAFRSNDWPSSKDKVILRLGKPLQSPKNSVASLESEAVMKQERIPTFFAESFPNAQRSSICAEGTSLAPPRVTEQNCITPPPMLGLGSPKNAKATIGDISESQVTVKLHGNAKLERESVVAQTTLDGDALADLSFAPESISRLQLSDEGDRSSLVSLPATSLTESSQTSSRLRPRARRRKSNGTYSILPEDFILADDLPFARDVQIRGFTVVGEKARGFVCYDVRVITTRGTTISILRRFSSFVSLRVSLASERPQYANSVPKLPPKRSGLLHKYASHHLEKRRKTLQKWLSVVMLDRRWATTKALQEWAVGNSDGS